MNNVISIKKNCKKKSRWKENERT